MEPVVFPDATSIVTTWLAAHLVEHVGSKIPNPRPTTFVTVTRTGGPRRNIIADNPQITLDTYGDTDQEAQDLAQVARAYVNALVGETVNGSFVSRVDELAGLANLPDPLSNQSRYRQSFALVAKGVVLTGS